MSGQITQLSIMMQSSMDLDFFRTPACSITTGAFILIPHQKN
jgi:hypothetical protein